MKKKATKRAKVQLHPQHELELRFGAENLNARLEGDSGGFAVVSASGFAVISATGFAVI